MDFLHKNYRFRTKFVKFSILVWKLWICDNFKNDQFRQKSATIISIFVVCFLTLWIFSFGSRELWQMELWKNGDSFKVAQLRLKLEKSHFLWFLPHFRHISTITRDAIQVFCQGFVELGRPLSCCSVIYADFEGSPWCFITCC